MTPLNENIVGLLTWAIRAHLVTDPSCLECETEDIEKMIEEVRERDKLEAEIIKALKIARRVTEYFCSRTNSNTDPALRAKREREAKLVAALLAKLEGKGPTKDEAKR